MKAVKEMDAPYDLAALAPHARLLLKLMQRDDVRPALGGESAVLDDRAGRERFVRLAMEHGVHGLAVSALVRSPLMEDLSHDARRDLTTSWARLRRQAALWDIERDRLLSVLAREGLDPVVLKGAALRETVYAEPAERSMGDLDLLLPAEQIDAARIALERVGYRAGGDQVLAAYRRHHFHVPLTHANGFVVEIHWALSRPALGFTLDERAFLSRALVRPRPAGRPLKVPSPEDMILHLASQNEEDAFGRLRRIADIDRVVAGTPRLDWAYVVEEARRGGVQTFAALSLRIAQLLLGTTVSDGIVNRLAPSLLSRVNLALLRPVAWALSEPGKRPAAGADVLLFWTTMDWRSRLHRYRVVVWPEADPMAWVYERRVQGERASARIGPLAKVAGYQLWMYARGAWAALTPSGRRSFAFWP